MPEDRHWEGRTAEQTPLRIPQLCKGLSTLGLPNGRVVLSWERGHSWKQESFLIGRLGDTP